MAECLITRRGGSGNSNLDVLKAIDSFTTKREDGTGSITISEDRKTVTATTTGTSSNQQGNVVYFSSNLFDLSKYKKLHFHLNKKGYGETRVCFYSSNTSVYGWDNIIAGQIFESHENFVDGEFEIDLESTDGKGYFGIGMSGFTTTPSWTGNTNTSIVSNLYLK